MNKYKIRSKTQKESFLKFLILFMIFGGMFLFYDQGIVNESNEDNLQKNENEVHSDQFYIDCLEKLTNRPICSAGEKYDLDYSTYIGGSKEDRGRSIAIDAVGCAYIMGYTNSSDFNTTTSAFDETFNGGSFDIFVCKLNDDGSDLEYSTFIGGNGNDYGYSIDVDAAGCAYITGYTTSSDFYTTTDAFDETLDGTTDVFVCKLNDDGSDLEYSTFIGGSDEEHGWSIAIDAVGCAYITGYTKSSDFYTTTDAFDETFNGDADVFVCKLNDDGSDLIYSTYIGGTNFDYGRSIAVDAAGFTYITGYTQSTDFNITTGTFDETYNGGTTDAFVCKLNDDGSDQEYSTYIGGNNYDYGYSIAVDIAGYAYITGYTQSTDFNITTDAFDETLDGTTDVFVCKLNDDGSDLEYSTFIGGTSSDYGWSITIDSSGCAYITGLTYSSDFNATTGAFDETYNGGLTDAFVCKLNADGSDLEYSTFIGGNNIELGYSITIDEEGNAYISGHTQSTDFNITTDAFDETYNGGINDVIVCKFNILSGGGGDDDDDDKAEDTGLTDLLLFLLVITLASVGFLIFILLLKKGKKKSPKSR